MPTRALYVIYKVGGFETRIVTCSARLLEGPVSKTAQIQTVKNAQHPNPMPLSTPPSTLLQHQNPTPFKTSQDKSQHRSKSPTHP